MYQATVTGAIETNDYGRRHTSEQTARKEATRTMMFGSRGPLRDLVFTLFESLRVAGYFDFAYAVDSDEREGAGIWIRTFDFLHDYLCLERVADILSVRKGT